MKGIIWLMVAVWLVWTANGAESMEGRKMAETHSKRLKSPPLGKTTGKDFKELPNWIYVPEDVYPAGGLAMVCGSDVDGDGFADLLIGESVFGEGRGRILVFYGGTNGFGEGEAINLPEEGPGIHWGEDVLGLGDVDGDAVDDWMALKRKKLEGGETSVYSIVIFGDRTRRFERTQEMPWGKSVFAVGDFNGDGFDDVGCTRFPEDQVEVYYGSRQGLEAVAGVSLRPEQVGSHFGHSIAGAGDVNGDGYDDLLVGARKFNGRYKTGGKAYLYSGSKEGLQTTAAWTAEYDLPVEKGVDDTHEQFFSYGITGAGDVNGDGFDDVVVGACFAEQGDRNEGMAFLFLGSKQGLTKSPKWIGQSNSPHALYGQAVGAAYDVNGDGFDDVLIGMPQASDGQQAEGAVAIYHGGTEGLGKWPAGIIESDHTHETLGAAVRSAGDINGDGYADVLLFGPGFEKVTEVGVMKFGRIMVCFGSPEGLPFRHQWSLKKPMLVAAQQRLDRYNRNLGSVVYWGPVALAFGGMAGGFLLVQNRMRKRIRGLLAENQKLVRSEERTRIARDIHDHLGADLTQISLRAKSAVQAGRAGEKEGEGTRLMDSVFQSSRKALETIDELIWVTDPRHDSLESLISQLGDFASRFLQEAGIRCVLKLPEELPGQTLSAEWRHDVFSVVKELLRNVVKHAAATEVTLSLATEGEEMRIELRDNGRGLSGPREGLEELGLAGSGGNGLRNVTARIRSLKGKVEITGQPGAGTRILMVIPFK